MTAVEDHPGTLVVTPRVVERIAARVLSEVDGVTGPPARIPGTAAHPRDPEVTARITGTTVHLRVRLSVHYPRPVVRTAATAQNHVAAKVESLTGLSVARVDIVVATLTTPTVHATRVH